MCSTSAIPPARDRSGGPGLRRGDGQVVVLFALALLVLIGVAALVFDVGQNFVDRRKEQDVADAAALAAARYLPDCPTPQSNANCPAAVNAAVALATSQGYTNGVNQAVVTVKIPPGNETEFAGIPDTVEVAISSTRGSIFLGALGQTTQRTAALGVAQNSSGYTLPYSLIALDPSGTTSLTGNGGAITTGGTVHIDSSASPALKLAGSGVINAPECDVVGSVQVSGGATNGCTSQPTGVTAFGDPLRELPPPPLPAAPASIQELAGTRGIPAGCPGNSPATAQNPGSGCKFSSQYKLGIDAFRLYPGFYPGGLNFQGGTFYLEPGIYWLGGGGYTQNGSSAMVLSVDPTLTTCTPSVPGPSSCGVLFYLGQDPDPTVSAACATTPGGPGCFAGWSMNGTAANLEIQGIQFGPYLNMVIYVDRAFKNATVTLNGASTNFSLTGTVYAPTATITVNGNGATSLSAQFIAWDFTAKGNGGAINVPYTADALFHLKGIGLVQ